jgi:hypothetical protein
MKKEEIYVVIDDEEKRLRAIQILSDSKENIWEGSRLLKEFTDEMIVRFNSSDNSWWTTYDKGSFIISLDQLEQMLNHQFVVKDIALPFEELQKQAELHGFKLVKEERQIKVGDFGKFLSENGGSSSFGFLYKIIGTLDTGFIYVENNKDITTHWSNFTHLTDEEKQQIQENW